ncbi:sulfatase [Marinilabilia rubra]|uniref:Sulfatase n=1 Tax=Marinilabilia rubra TaxID=2162893 RepID=A0A2U2B7F7_9BACT|nr:sulfatase [Marinilabilia rubra]PWD98982.1 sulfatase [Marinilabilia rubra]
MKNFFFILLFVWIAVPVEAERTETRPNVVFFLVDDLGWKDLGCYGSNFYQTPNVDNLADESVSFDNAYAACTVCSPTRASIMTGKYPATVNLTDWITGWKYPFAKLEIPDWTMHLDTSATTLADVFKANGYITGHFGKWHLGKDSVYWPKNQGFDVNIGGCDHGSPQRRPKKGFNGYFSPYGNPRLTAKSKDEYITERLAEEARTFIKENKKRPFFLNFWLYNVHTPLQARKEKIEKYKALVDSSLLQKNPAYAAMVEHMDDAVGAVINELKALDLYENTIIVFTSDNGGLIGRGKRKITSNYPLRSGKGDAYEGGVRVPLIIKTPSMQNQRGSISSEPVVSPDLMPTLIDLAGLNVEGNVKSRFDGVNLSPLLDDVEADIQREVIFWHYPHYHGEGATPYSAVRKEGWKLIHFYETDTYELYNLKKDIGEKENLFDMNKQKASELKNALKRMIEKTDAQLPSANPAYDPSRAGKYHF